MKKPEEEVEGDWALGLGGVVGVSLGAMVVLFA